MRREVLGRYRGSVLGLGWAVLSPLVMLAVYTFVFSSVFKSRWPGSASASGIDFALHLFAGLLVFNLFSEVCSRAPMLVVEQPNLVKKVAFPLELLPFVCLGAALFNFAVNGLILVLGVVIFEPGGFSLDSLLAPVVVFPLLPLLLGMAWVFAALGVYIRDLGTVVTVVMNLLMFLSPVFYSVSSLPEQYRGWLQWNPLVPVIESLRAVLFGGEVLWLGVGGLLLAGLALAGLGAMVFALLRRGFADVL